MDPNLEAQAGSNRRPVGDDVRQDVPHPIRVLCYRVKDLGFRVKG